MTNEYAPVVYLSFSGNTLDNELYHHGVKGMKWGVRKSISNASQSIVRFNRSVSAASIEARRNRIERLLARNKSRQKDSKVDYSKQNIRYRAKLNELKKLRNQKISNLSEYDIERGRTAYKTIKGVSVSVAVTAAAAIVGTVSAPAAMVTKLAGSAVSTVVKDQ